MEAAELERLKTDLLHSMEDALTLRRPCCGEPVAFGGWDKCCSVSCDICSVAFCGVCLGYSAAGDVHDHVRSCAKNPSGNLFPPAEDIRAAHTSLARVRLQVTTAARLPANMTCQCTIMLL